MPCPSGNKQAVLIDDTDASACAKAVRTSRNKLGDKPFNRLIVPVEQPQTTVPPGSYMMSIAISSVLGVGVIPNVI